MRVGVISDTHGDKNALSRALEKLQDMDAWIHLGDVLADAGTLAEATKVPVYSVRGNCDYDTSCPEEQVIEIGGVRMFLCHGHRYGVRYDRSKLFYRAEELNCALVLYGHSHVSLIEASGAVLALNPGSPSLPREGRAPSCARIRIENGEAYPEIILI